MVRKVNDLDQYLNEKRNIINRALKDCLPQSGPPAVREAMDYSLDAGGKRLRPILAMGVADTLNYEDSSVIDVACALELIHTYSLIHDDLPAMDNSDLRRGKPTCHRVFGDAIAVLAGDALLTLAFEMISRYGQKNGSANKAMQIAVELASAAGVNGMIGGQVLDLESEGKQITESELETMSSMKTGALLKASVMCGAIAAGATLEQKKYLANYATCIGTAFQIIDDLLDYESSEEELGKPVGSDQERFKPNYPSILGPKKARKQAELLHQQAVDNVKKLNGPVDLLTGLAERIVNRKK
ncbi:MAG: polyprenyl synthetase family protein [Bacillota bacterium]